MNFYFAHDFEGWSLRSSSCTWWRLSIEFESKNRAWHEKPFYIGSLILFFTFSPLPSTRYQTYALHMELRPPPFLKFWDRVLLNCPTGFQTCSPPAPPSGLLGIHICTPAPSSFLYRKPKSHWIGAPHLWAHFTLSNFQNSCHKIPQSDCFYPVDIKLQYAFRWEHSNNSSNQTDR